MSDTPDLPMTTGLELPGVRIRENLGVCYGLVVRSMGLVGGVTSSFRALRRGEVSEYTQLLEDSRRHAIDRMSDNARLLGADAIVASPLRLLGDRQTVHRDRRVRDGGQGRPALVARRCCSATPIASCCTRR